MAGKNAAWRKSMELKVDYNNMMAEYIGEEQGYTVKDFAKNSKLINDAYKAVNENRGKGMMGWTELPYNQDEIVKDIILTAKDIKKKFDNFVVLGIGGSALGPIAVFQALCHLRHNELPKSKRKFPKLYVEDNVDPERMKALLDVIDYAADPSKTDSAIHDENIETHQQFVTGINCLPATARDEMQAVKKRFGKEDGVIAYHGYQSFAPGEADPKTAHEIGIRLAKELWDEKYQVVVATHLDKDNHLHNHFVVNTVSFVDGTRYHRTGKDYHNMQVASDNLCREYGLSVVENVHYGKSKQYGEWRAEQEQRPTWRGFIKADIDEAIRMSLTERQFFRHLEEKGYEIKFGKDISVRPQGKERFVRLMRNFGEEYSIENIRRRILSQFIPE